MLDYYIAKIAQINYKISIHPDDANTRLTSQADRILVVVPSVVPAQFREQFTSLIDLINVNYVNAQRLGVGLRPHKLSGINKNAAAVYIKVLIDIEHSLELENGRP